MSIMQIKQKLGKIILHIRCYSAQNERYNIQKCIFRAQFQTAYNKIFDRIKAKW